MKEILEAYNRTVRRCNKMENILETIYNILRNGKAEDGDLETLKLTIDECLKLLEREGFTKSRKMYYNKNINNIKGGKK